MGGVMSSVTISGDTSGSIILQAPSVAGSTTLTLPTTSGTVLTTANTFGAGTGPAFSAWQSSPQTLPTNTFTKITFTTELWDTNNNYASSTFTPTVAGYYQINAGLYTITNQNVFVTVIYRNGTAYKQQVQGGASALNGSGTSGIVYCNGTTDYIEIYGYMSTGSALLASQSHTWFDGALIRSA